MRQPTEAIPRRSTQTWVAPAAWAALLAAALALRTLGITKTSVWFDEAYTLVAARMSWSDLLFRFSLIESNPPLHFIVTKLAYYVSDSEVWHRSISVMLGMGTVILITRWVRYTDVRAGWAAGWLAATCPIFCHYSQELRTYPLVFFCMALCLWSIEAFAFGRRYCRWIWPIAAAAAIASHFVSWLALPAILIYAWARRAWTWRNSGPLFLLAILAILPAWLAWHHAMRRSEVGLYYPKLAWDSTKMLFDGLIGTNAIEIWRGDPAPLWKEIAAISVQGALELSLGLLAALPLLLGNSRLRRLAGFALSMALLFIGCQLVFSIALTPIFLPRTTALVWLPIIWLTSQTTGTGMSPIGRRVGITVLTLWAVLWGLVWGAVALSDQALRPPEKPLFQFVSQWAGPTDWYICSPATVTWSAAYYLGDVASGERLLDHEFPAFEGRSPVRMVPVYEQSDPEWIARIERQLTPEVTGPTPPAVWFLNAGLNFAGDEEQIALEDWLRSHNYRPAESSVIENRWILSATRWVAKPATGTGL